MIILHPNSFIKYNLHLFVSDYEAPGRAWPRSGAMWSAGVFFLTHIVVCQFATGE